MASPKDAADWLYRFIVFAATMPDDIRRKFNERKDPRRCPACLSPIARYGLNTYVEIEKQIAYEKRLSTQPGGEEPIYACGARMMGGFWASSPECKNRTAELHIGGSI